MLRVAEQWHDSDQGRQRRGNEDNYFVRSPLFVVADGMGGAQAGEVASEVAVRAFARGLPDGSPAAGLVRTIEQANREIHDMARAEREKAGMGTTLTAAFLTQDDEVVVAHVGDSRCYLLRDGDLVRLTRDHSLVGELIARGKLTEEQAEQHPQRSVITRALGAGPTVEVDVDVFPARAGDVFLLCSDGLTSMVPEPRIAPLVSERASLQEAGNALIAAANEAGGRDNITVILFRLESVADGRAAPAGTTSEQAAVPEAEERAPGPAAAGDDDGEGAPLARRAGGATAQLQAQARDVPRRTVSPPAAAGRSPEPERPAASPGRRRGRALKISLVVLVVVLALSFAAWSASRAVYFLGTDVEDGRTITIFRGLPFELPGGVRLYERYAGSGVTLEQVPPARRDTFTNHELRSLEDVEDLVTELERGRLRG